MSFFVTLLVIAGILIFVSYKCFKMLINEILDKLVILDKIFEERYNDLSKSIAQFQKYLPEERDLIFDIQRAKADVAKIVKPKTTDELAQKITNENALSINVNALLSKCDFQKVPKDLKVYLETQADYINKIDNVAQDYNKLITNYQSLKQMFPFNYYSQIININLNLDTIKTR